MRSVRRAQPAISTPAPAARPALASSAVPVPLRHAEQRTPPRVARRLLLAWLVGVAVLLMHASASAGCPGGTHSAAEVSAHMPMAGAATAAPAVAVAVMDSPSSLLVATADDGGEVCVSLPPCPWLAGLLRLLPLAVAGAAAWLLGAHHALPRWGRRWRAPPLTGSLLTRICVCRT